MTPQQQAQRLREAARIVGERGWCRTRYEDEHGHVCIKGAIRLACGERTLGTDRRASETLIRVVGRRMDALGFEIEWSQLDTRGPDNDYWIDVPAIWNNLTAKSVDDIVHALKLIAEDVELDAV